MKLLPATLAVLALTMLARAGQPAAALTFTFTVIDGDTLTAGQQSAFSTAANAWGALLDDSVTVNLQIGFAALGAGVLGQTGTSRALVSYASVAARLVADASSAADASATAHLPASAGITNLVVTSAQARALGFTTPGTTYDASIEFSTGFTFAETRNADGSTPAGAYDLIGVAMHEIGHALGFLSDADGALPRTVLDLFRYMPGSTALSFSNGAAASFSIDGGATDLASFSSGITYQASHWAAGSSDGAAPLLMNPALPAGQTQNIQPLDLLALDVIGWDVAEEAASVPEPSSLALLAGGVASLAARRRVSRAA